MQTLKVASDLRRTSGAFENPVIVIITLVVKKAQDKVVKLCMANLGSENFVLASRAINSPR